MPRRADLSCRPCAPSRHWPGSQSCWLSRSRRGTAMLRFALLLIAVLPLSAEAVVVDLSRFPDTGLPVANGTILGDREVDRDPLLRPHGRSGSDRADCRRLRHIQQAPLLPAGSLPRDRRLRLRGARHQRSDRYRGSQGDPGDRGPAGKGKLQLQAPTRRRRARSRCPRESARHSRGKKRPAAGADEQRACFEATLGTVKKADGLRVKAKAP